MIEALDTKNDYREKISKHADYCLTSTNLTTDEYYKGKVRDRYDLGDTLALITTDRQSPLTGACKHTVQRAGAQRNGCLVV